MTTEQKIVPEKDFSSILDPFAKPFLSISHHAETSAHKNNSKRLHMGFLANVIKHASDVEHLLDRYRARYNRNWLYFRELTATSKNFGKAVFLLEELKKNYNTEYFTPQGRQRFEQMSNKATRFLNDVLVRTFLELQGEARRLGLTIPEELPLSTYGLKFQREMILPHTIEESTLQEANVTVKILNRFKAFAKEAQFLGEVITAHDADMITQIPANINEGKLRRLGTRLHNLVSWYDSYVVNHSIESEFPELKTLRETLTVQHNLSKIGTILAHYFERHLMIPSPVANRLREIVPVNKLLKEAFRFTLYYMVDSLRFSRAIVNRLLPLMLEEATYELPVPKTLGFHARPCTLVAKVVQEHGASVKLLVDDQCFDAGSILELLSAGGYIVTKGLNSVRFQGDKRALDDLDLLSRCNYGETENGKDINLPEGLSYLKQGAKKPPC